MNDEDFDGSALRELLTPVVADRGRTSAPTDAIVAAGRRRVVRRRTAVAGGALAIVAAVPLAASAIAAGPGTAHNTGAASTTGTTKPATPTPPSKPTPAHSDAQVQTKGNTPANPTPNPTQKPDTGAAASLPKTPILLGSGVIEGKHWSVSGVGSGGNNDLTAKDQCLKLVVTENGRTTDPSLGVRLLYCLPGPVQGYMLEEMQYDIQGGAGNVAIGTIPADVAKIVAHVGGSASAPLTIATVPAPGAPDTAIFVIPASGVSPSIAFDEYNAQGVKIGSWDNSAPDFSKQ